MMISKSFLEKQHKKMLEKYSKNSYSTPIRMFKNNLFNEKNWCGGDDLIRFFFNDIEEGTINKCYILDTCKFICNVDRVEDDAIATIVVDIPFEKIDTYLFKWYKNRGCTELAIFNGKSITEDEYINLLNLIEKTGYNFKEEIKKYI
ncbi:hypothetical protein [Clostridium perfringens]|nr:hypothetical protein [Clostridium perfringens]